MENQNKFRRVRRHRASTARRSSATTKPLLDKTSFADWPELREALDHVPECRPEAVALARRLIADPGYPPPHVQRVIAQKLASELSSETEPPLP